MNIYDRKDKINKGYGSIQTYRENTEYEHRRGTFTLPEGIVQIYHCYSVIIFSILIDGYEYTRTITNNKKQYTDLGLTRVAAKYGRETIKRVRG